MGSCASMLKHTQALDLDYKKDIMSHNAQSTHKSIYNDDKKNCTMYYVQDMRSKRV